MKTVLTSLAAFHAFLVIGGEPDDKMPTPITATASIRLIERGAILVEDFDSTELDLTRWRVWQNNPDRTTVRQENGRLNITARGRIAMEGLWGLTTAKYKDVVLVGEMDIRSKGTAPHRLALHLCGGDGLRSPDRRLRSPIPKGVSAPSRISRFSYAQRTAKSCRPFSRHTWVSICCH